MSRVNEVGAEHTAVFTEKGWTKVVYWKTAVVQFNYAYIELRNGGHETQATKARMNQASQQYGLGYEVKQKGHEWFVYYDDQVIKFVDGMILSR